MGCGTQAIPAAQTITQIQENAQITTPFPGNHLLRVK